MIIGSIVLDKPHKSTFILDQKHRGVFVLVGYLGKQLLDLDGETLGHFDPMTLREIEIP